MAAPTKSEAVSQSTPQVYEILDAKALASRLALPESWIREMCRTRCSDPLPALVFGRYKRFRWNSPELNAWIARRMKGGAQ